MGYDAWVTVYAPLLWIGDRSPLVENVIRSYTGSFGFRRYGIGII
jgi:hypothetical protein